MTEDEEMALIEIERAARALVDETEDGWGTTAKRLRDELKAALDRRMPHAKERRREVDG